MKEIIEKIRVVMIQAFANDEIGAFVKEDIDNRLNKIEKELSKDTEILDWIVKNPYKAMDMLTHQCIREDFRNAVKQAMKGE